MKWCLPRKFSANCFGTLGRSSLRQLHHPVGRTVFTHENEFRPPGRRRPAESHRLAEFLKNNFATLKTHNLLAGELRSDGSYRVLKLLFVRGTASRACRNN